MSTQSAAPGAKAAPKDAFSLTSSRGFAEWLAGADVSLAFTTGAAGRFFLVGLGPTGRPALIERTFARCKGLAVSADARTLFLASDYQLLRFDSVSQTGDGAGHQDAVYSPHVAWITGDIDAQDIAVLPNRRPVFASALYSCVGAVSEGFSFRPLWRPPFVTRLASDDRCHLTGVALDKGQPRYVTLAGASDAADGWRAGRADGGLVMDMQTNAVLASGLALPHSPRVRDGQVWLLNAGAGELGFVEPGSDRLKVVAACPGFVRGLAFTGPFAVVGVSLGRGEGGFDGLPLAQTLTAKGLEPRCAVLVIDTRTGETVEWLRIDGAVREIHAVELLTGIRNPASIGLESEEIQRIVTIDPS